MRSSLHEFAAPIGTRRETVPFSHYSVRAVGVEVDELILFGAVGFERCLGGSGGLGSVDDGGRRRTVALSDSITFNDADGRSITVTSHRPADDDEYLSLRNWVPMNTYLGTPEGRNQLQARREIGQSLEPFEVDWQPASIQDRQAVEAHWLARIDAALSETTERLRFKHIDALHNSRVGRHLRGKFLFQLWFNTLGLGAKTWFGNRLAPVRRFRFRLYWRP